MIVIFIIIIIILFNEAKNGILLGVLSCSGKTALRRKIMAPIGIPVAPKVDWKKDET